MSERYLIITYGCQMNVRDSEAMAGMLEAQGYERADGAEDADLILLNTCTVREGGQTTGPTAAPENSAG
jgi:tRNA-2-methylthio-N6-dimethylallyladenosine synthase